MAGRRERRTYPASPYPFPELRDIDGFGGRPPAPFPSGPYVPMWAQSPWQASNRGLPPPNSFPPGTFVPRWAPGYGPAAAQSPWPTFSGLPPPEAFPPGTFVPQWAPAAAPSPRQSGLRPFPPGTFAPQYASGLRPPPGGASWRDPDSPFLPPAYDFAPLEDTDRLPRPSDMLPWAMQPSPWADGLGVTPMAAPGFGTPLQTPLGLPMIEGGGPITPMPMNSPFPTPSFPMPFPNSPFPMTPGALGPDIQPILFAKKYPYEQENLASRPSDWRHDYLPPRRFRFPRLGGAEIKVNLEHCHLSPLLLMPNSKMPIMSFDLRSDHPFDPLNLELLTTAGRSFNPTDLAQLATTRPVRRLRFYHPRIPWYIDVRASQPNGILVGDVLHQIHEKLQRPIRPQDFSNTVLDATDRELITDAYRARCDDRVDIMQQGVHRVDFMGSDVILQGFMEGRNGMWLMKTTRFNRNMDS